MRGKTKTRTIYNEKYFARTVHVTEAEALKIASEASCIYAVEQGEIEIPSYENQRRVVCVMRFERIITEPKAADAVDPVEGVDTEGPCATNRADSSPKRCAGEARGPLT